MLMLIFSIYLLVLPGISCAGTDTCKEETENEATQTAVNTGHEDEKDDCGSFCTCSCCVHIVSVNFQSAIAPGNKPIDENRQAGSYYSISLPSNYFGNIWQPPRIG